MRPLVHITRHARTMQRRAAQASAVQTGPPSEWHEAEEDEMGRPLCCPPGLGAKELLPQEEYWQARFDAEPWNSNYDRPGNQMKPTERAEGAPYFNTNPDVGDNPLTLDTALASRVPMQGCCPDEINVPVFDLDKNQVGVRKLDPYIFGCAPEADMLHQMWNYELSRASGFGGWERLDRRDAPGPTRRLVPWYKGPGTRSNRRHGNWKAVNTVSGAAPHSRRKADLRRDADADHQSWV